MKTEMDKLDQFNLDKSDYKPKWFMLSVSFWINTAAYYCYDHPAALHNTLKNHFLDLIDEDTFEIYFGGLYSVYAFANIFLPFISGQLRDIHGDRIMLILLCLILIIGQSIFCYGILIKSFFVMYFGRILLGWGICSCTPTQNSLVSAYFWGDMLSFVASLNELFANIGSILCMWYLPILADRHGVVLAVFSGVILNIFAFFCSLIVFLFDKNASTQALEKINKYQVGQEDTVVIQSISFWRSAFDLSDLIKLGPLFWYMSVFLALIITSLMSMINVSVGLLSERWLYEDPNAEMTAGQMVGYVWLVTGFTTPITGYMVDYFKNRAFMCIFVALATTLSQLMIWYYDPLIGLMMLGLTYNFAYIIILTGVLIYIHPRLYGKAFGCNISLQQIGTSLVPLLVGILRSIHGTYFYSQMLLAGLGIVACLIAILMYYQDRKQNNPMDYNPHQYQQETEFVFPKPETAQVENLDEIHENILS